MNIVDRKSKDTSKNYFYGVDVNDKQAVQREYERLNKQHKIVTIIVILALGILAFFGFDFYRVNFMEGKPIFALESAVERGTLFKGLGYNVLYCDNGERYIGSVLYKTCEEPDQLTFTNIVYEKFVDYSVSNKTLDKNKLDKLTITNLVFDEENDQGGSDYLLEIAYECKDGSSKCLKTVKEYNDPLKIKLYVKINKYNEVYDVVSFKTSGAYYEQLKENYTEKIKTYLIEKGLFKEENVRLFSIELEENYGKYKFRGNSYADSYLAVINYMCKDNSNTCVEAFDKKDLEGDYANLAFYSSLFLDEEDNILLMGPREYFELD